VEAKPLDHLSLGDMTGPQTLLEKLRETGVTEARNVLVRGVDRASQASRASRAFSEVFGMTGDVLAANVLICRDFYAAPARAICVG
jgi:hypothetical protein